MKEVIRTDSTSIRQNTSISLSTETQKVTISLLQGPADKGKPYVLCNRRPLCCRHGESESRRASALGRSDICQISSTYPSSKSTRQPSRLRKRIRRKKQTEPSLHPSTGHKLLVVKEADRGLERRDETLLTVTAKSDKISAVISGCSAEVERTSLGDWGSAVQIRPARFFLLFFFLQL